MIDEEKDQTVFIFSTSLALSAFLAQIFLNPEKKESSTVGSDPGHVPQLPSGLGNLTNQTLIGQSLNASRAGNCPSVNSNGC